MKIIFLLLFFSVGLLAPMSIHAQDFSGQAEQVFPTEPFDQVEIRGSFNLIIAHTSKHRITATSTQKADFEHLQMTVTDGILYIKAADRHYFGKVTIQINVPYLRHLSSAGSGKITVGKFPQLTKLHIENIGSGDVTSSTPCHIKGELKLHNRGSGSIQFKGSATSVEVYTRGSGNIHLDQLTVQYAKVSTYGAGHVQVHVRQSLEANVLGSGTIKYKGNPEVVHNITGSGSVSKL